MKESYSFTYERIQSKLLTEMQRFSVYIPHCIYNHSAPINRHSLAHMLEDEPVLKHLLNFPKQTEAQRIILIGNGYNFTQAPSC